MKSKFLLFLCLFCFFQISCSIFEEKQTYIEEQTFPISIKALKADGSPLKVKGLKFILNDISSACGNVPRTEFLTDENGLINSSIVIPKHYADVDCSYDIFAETYTSVYTALASSRLSLPVQNAEVRFAKQNYVKFTFLNDTASIEKLYCATRMDFNSQVSIDYYRNVNIKIQAGKSSSVILPGVRDTCFYFSYQAYNKDGKATYNHRFYINNEQIFSKCLSGQNKDTTEYTISIK